MTDVWVGVLNDDKAVRVDVVFSSREAGENYYGGEWTWDYSTGMFWREGWEDGDGRVWTVLLDPVALDPQK